MNTKIAIGIPCNREFKPKTVESLLGLITYFYSDFDFFFVVATQGYTISENRAYIVAQARQNECDYLLFVDDDMMFPPDTLQRLIKHDKDIVGIVSNSRKLPLTPTVECFKGQEIQKELFKVKAVGGGIMLIKMDIFKKIDKPYFSTEVHENGFTLMGEDSWFCRQIEIKE